MKREKMLRRARYIACLMRFAPLGMLAGIHISKRYMFPSEIIAWVVAAILCYLCGSFLNSWCNAAEELLDEIKIFRIE